MAVLGICLIELKQQIKADGRRMSKPQVPYGMDKYRYGQVGEKNLAKF